MKGRPISAKARGVFLAELALTCNVTGAATKAGHNRRAFYRVGLADREFGEAWDEALAEAIDRLEAQLFQFAIEGAEERTYDADGNPCRAGSVKIPRRLRGCSLRTGRRSTASGTA